MDEHPGPLPPGCMQSDDPAAANLARRRVRSQKKRLLPHLRRRKQSTGAQSQEAQRPAVKLDDGVPRDLVDLSVTYHDEEEERDVYRWAVMYENQRGLTMFSTPYYSSLGLLPRDPPPFTVPDAECGGKQPKVSLNEYPLPDGTWKWVSKAWMIDMRGDGAVQYDGFEYNWFFRRHHWRAEVGHFSTGGWVRRRRWVRLMFKPAKRRQHAYRLSGLVPPDGSPRPDSVVSSAPGSSLPPSVFDMLTASSAGGAAGVGEVWRGDAAGDWARCAALMRRFGRDGRKLELWRTWLSAHVPGALAPPGADGAGGDAGDARPRKQWTEDSGMMPSERDYVDRAEATAARTLEVDKEAIAAVLREHGREIVESFIYPDSKAQFLALLEKAGLRSEVGSALGGAGASRSSGLFDFWSYNDDDTGSSDPREDYLRVEEKGKGKTKA